MTECIPHMEAMTTTAKMITLSFGINILCWAGVIWATLRLRRAYRDLGEHP